MIDQATTAAARRARWLALTALAGVGVHGLAWASDNAPFAAPLAASAAGPAAGTVRVTLAMMLVLGAVLAAAWLLRRFRNLSGSTLSGLEVLAQVSLGTRERAVLIRIGDRQLLLGVAPGNVRTLHVIETPLAAALAGAQPALTNAAAASPSRPNFKALLLKSLGK